MENIVADIASVILAAGVPSAILGVFIRRFEKSRDEDKKAKEAQEKARRQYEAFQVQMLTAVTKLSEATAIALQTGKCNGAITEAMKYLDEVRHAQREFLINQGIGNIF